MLAPLAHFLVLLALVTSAWGAFINLRAAQRPNLSSLESGRRSALAVFALLTAATGALLWLLVSREFQVAYVAQTTSRDLGFVYTLAALWGGNDGSLLFWSWLLSGYTLAVVLRHRRHPILPWVLFVLFLLLIFFLYLTGFVANPFRLLPSQPADGSGLNPLLRNGYMVAHPPNLYLGYVGWSVPFAFAIAALLSGRAGDEWVRLIRGWALVPWFFLSVGLILGGKWAYEVLGWGGYWGWDPVENAALLPWLTGTAFLHSIIIQARRGMFRVWNVILIIATFGLSILGTFLTRSGLIASVHSFARSAIGFYFLGFLALYTLGSLALLFQRLPQLRSRNELESVASRESAFLFNNLIFLAIAFAVLWGTLFPMISEALRGVKITVGPPYYERVVGPLGFALLLLLGLGPIIPWRQASLRRLVSELRLPLGVGAGVALVLFMAGVREPLGLGALGLLAAVGLVNAREFHKAALIRRRASGEGYLPAMAQAVARLRGRYGGYLIHLGVVMIGLALVGSSLQLETAAALRPGESLSIGRYTLQYNGLTGYADGAKDAVLAPLNLWVDDRPAGVIQPGRYFYRASGQPVSKLVIQSSPREDLYVILGRWEGAGEIAEFRAFVNPLVFWLWVGGVVLILGALIAAWPEGRARPKEVEVEETARVAAGQPGLALALYGLDVRSAGRGPAGGAGLRHRQEALLSRLRADAARRLRDAGLPRLAGPDPAEAGAGGDGGGDHQLLRGQLRGAGAGLASAAGLQPGRLAGAWGRLRAGLGLAGASDEALVAPAGAANAPAVGDIRGVPQASRGGAGALTPRLSLSLLRRGTLILLVLGALTLMGAGLRSQLQGPLASGPAPDFSLQTFDGQTIRLSDYRGKVVMVNIWASWCLPCREEAPVLQAAYEEWADDGLVIIGVNWVDTEDKAREFIEEFGLTYPNGPDLEQRIARAFRMKGIPETYFIDRQGSAVYAHVGPLTPQMLEERLLPILKEAR